MLEALQDAVRGGERQATLFPVVSAGDIVVLKALRELLRALLELALDGDPARHRAPTRPLRCDARPLPAKFEIE